MRNKLFVILAAFALFGGCSQKEQPVPGGSESTGSIVINLTSETTRMLQPSLDMLPASYDIIGDGPGAAAFSITSTQSSVILNKLAFGQWIVTATARNAGGIAIGQGTQTVQIHTGQTASVNITVLPYNGNGTLSLTVNWNAADTEIPSIAAQLVPVSGAPIDLSFTVSGGNNGVFSSSTIPSGYYTLVVKLLDNGILTFGAVEIVRIIQGQITSGTFNFNEINRPGGSVQMGITPEMNNPLTVNLSGQVSVIAPAGTMNLSASVAPEAGNVTYVWYLNGESKTSGSTYLISELETGVYRVDVTAITADGKRAGTASYTFHVTPNWTRTLGSSEDEMATGITADSNGDLIVAGQTKGSLGNNQSNGLNDIVLAKYNPAGTLLWLKTLGTAGDDKANAVTVDSQGNIYITGSTAGALDGNTHSGLADIFVAKFDAAGNKLWVKQTGSASNDEARAILLDAANSIYIAGSTQGNLDGQTNYGDHDIFVAKFDAAGNKQWVVLSGSSYIDIATSLALDAQNAVYVTGVNYGSLDGNMNPNPGTADSFLQKYSASGTKLWTKTIGNNGYDVAYGITLDANGNSYMTGYTTSGFDGLPFGGWNDMFVVKHDAAGNKLFSKLIGMESADGATVSAFVNGELYIAGHSMGSLGGFPNYGGFDLVLLKLNPANGDTIWTKMLGGAQDEGSSSIASNGARIYISGYTRGSLDGNISAGQMDIFITSFDLNGTH